LIQNFSQDKGTIHPLLEIPDGQPIDVALVRLVRLLARRTAQELMQEVGTSKIAAPGLRGKTT